MTRSQKRFDRILFVFIVAVIVGPLVYVSVARGASPRPAPAPAMGGRVHQPCMTVPACHRALAWHRRYERHLLAVKMLPDVELGYTLALGLYHVDLHRLGYCESRNNPYDRLGQYRGITQQGYGFEARNRDVYRLLPIWNPIANILVAARHIARAGDGEWQCALDGHVRHGGAYS